MLPKLRAQLGELREIVQRETLISEQKSEEIERLSNLLREKDAEIGWYKRSFSRIIAFSTSVDEMVASKPSSFSTSFAICNAGIDDKKTDSNPDFSEISTETFDSVPKRAFGAIDDAFEIKMGEFLNTFTAVGIDERERLKLCRDLCIAARQIITKVGDYRCLELDSWVEECRTYADSLAADKPINMIALLESLEKLVMKLERTKVGALENDDESLMSQSTDAMQRDLNMTLVSEVISGFNVFGTFIVQSRNTSDSVLKLPQDVSKAICGALFKALDVCDSLEGSLSTKKLEICTALIPIRDALQVRTEEVIMVGKPDASLLENTRRVIFLFQSLLNHS
jgi:hypothetical protein